MTLAAPLGFSGSGKGGGATGQTRFIRPTLLVQKFTAGTTTFGTILGVTDAVPVTPAHGGTFLVPGVYVAKCPVILPAVTLGGGTHPNLIGAGVYVPNGLFPGGITVESILMVAWSTQPTIFGPTSDWCELGGAGFPRHLAPGSHTFVVADWATAFAESNGVFAITSSTAGGALGGIHVTAQRTVSVTFSLSVRVSGT